MSFQSAYSRENRRTAATGRFFGAEDIPAGLLAAVGAYAEQLLPESSGEHSSYAYSLFTREGMPTTLHLLTRTTQTQDFTVQHHVILTADDVEYMRRNANRPTPAGIMLALSRLDFWMTTPDAEFRTPEMTAAALPSNTADGSQAEVNDLARRLREQSESGSCIIRLPEKADGETCLHLLHESDRETPGKGWDKTFCTAIPADGSVFARVFAEADTAVPSGYAAHHILTLTADNGQKMPGGEQLSPESNTGNGNETGEPAPEAEPQHSHPLLRWAAYLAGLCLLGSAVHLTVSSEVDDAGVVTGNLVQTAQNEARDILLKMLRDAKLLNDTETGIPGAETAAEADGTEQILHRCVELLQHAGDTVTGHPENLKQLLGYAAELQVDTHAVVRLYLRQVGSRHTEEDWRRGITTEEKEAWLQLLREHPGLRQVLKDELPAVHGILTEGEESSEA